MNFESNIYKTLLTHAVRGPGQGNAIRLTTSELRDRTYRTYKVNRWREHASSEIVESYATIHEAIAGHTKWRFYYSDYGGQRSLYQSFAIAERFLIYRPHFEARGTIRIYAKSLLAIQGTFAGVPAYHLYFQKPGQRRDFHENAVHRGPLLILKGWHHTLDPDDVRAESNLAGIDPELIFLDARDFDGGAA